MMVEYPDIDVGVVDSARAALAAVLTNRTETETAIAEVGTALEHCLAIRAGLIDRQARGESVDIAEQRKNESAIMRHESQLIHLRGVVARQGQIVTNAEEICRLSDGRAHHPRVVHAIREQAAMSEEMDRLHRAVWAAERRQKLAKDTLLEAFGAGYPLPPLLRPHQSGGWMGPTLPGKTDEASLRALWGDVADEAIGPVAEAAE